MLLIGLLLGLTEVSLSKINHYLAPIVNELKALWEGVTLGTYERQEGRRIRAALIMVACNILTVRKICRHISALVFCHRCQKHANYEDHQYNFTEIEDMED